jgi:putative ABC transport system ATP-binding protein
MAANGSVVDCAGVTKVYRQGTQEVHALRGLTLEVAEGEFTAICGPSGSGKTTLLNLIGALDRPTAGSIHLEGRDLGAMGQRERSRLRRDRIGFVFQAYNLMPVLSAYENAEMVLALQGAPVEERHERVEGILRDVGLEGLEDRRPDELSGGQQQRVAIARAIASDPAVVLADEPTANLDSENAGNLLDIMEKQNRERGVTFLFSTHDARVMERARRIVRVVDGRVESDGIRL